MKPTYKIFVAAILAAFFMASAQAQNTGTVSNHGFALGKGPGVQGFTSLICGNTQIPVGQASADPICAALSGDVTMTSAGVTAIGASKVTNSQLANMAANTTKCNATGGSAAPTDCDASTMRSNIGSVIGTNVQAWDTDLDCLAALSSTGTIKRTGAGTCSAGTVALSDLATGTQDTVIGYFGSTTSSASAIGNCSSALTYSTSTHTFGCNTLAGTGTVTSIGLTNTYGLSVSGSPVTSSGNISAGVSLTSASNVLGSNVAMNNTGLYFDGPSMSNSTTGLWFATGGVTVQDTSGAAQIRCKLWDGSHVIDSKTQYTPAASAPVAIHLAGTLASPAANIKISCNDISSTSGQILFNNSTNSKDSTVYGFRIQ